MKIILYSILLSLTFVLLLQDPIANIGIAKLYAIKVYFLGIPTADIALLLMLIIFSTKIKIITNYVNGKFLVLFGVVIVYLLIQGIINMGVSNLSIFNADIRRSLWFFGGIAFAYSMVKTKNILTVLNVIVIVSAYLLVLSSIYSAGFSDYAKGWYAGRIGHPNIYILGGWLVVPLVLLSNLTPPLLSKKIIPFVGMILFFFFVAILSSTRSSTVIAFSLFIIFSISFKFNPRNSKIFFVKYKKRNKLFISIIMIIVTIYFLFYIEVYRYERLLSIFDYQIVINDSRIYELIDFFEQSDFQQLLFGRGFGGQIKSYIYEGESTQTLHIGILNFWIRMGFFPFLIIVFYLYIRVPARYVKTFRLISASNSSYYDTANVVLLSALFPWILSLLMSGGFDQISFLFLGFVLYMHGIIRVHGINPLINSSNYNYER